MNNKEIEKVPFDFKSLVVIGQSFEDSKKVDRWIRELYDRGKTFVYIRDSNGVTNWDETSRIYQVLLARIKSEHVIFYERLSEMHGNFSGIDCTELVVSGWKGQFDWHEFALECKSKAQFERFERYL